MSELTEQQQVDESIAAEAHFGSYGRLVYGYDDPDLTPFQREYCHNVLSVGHRIYGRQLSEQHGEEYPLSALSKRIDAEIEKHKPSRQQ